MKGEGSSAEVMIKVLRRMQPRKQDAYDLRLRADARSGMGKARQKEPRCLLLSCLLVCCLAHPRPTRVAKFIVCRGCKACAEVMIKAKCERLNN